MNHPGHGTDDLYLLSARSYPCQSSDHEQDSSFGELPGEMPSGTVELAENPLADRWNQKGAR